MSEELGLHGVGRDRVLEIVWVDCLTRILSTYSPMSMATWHGRGGRFWDYLLEGWGFADVWVAGRDLHETFIVLR